MPSIHLIGDNAVVRPGKIVCLGRNYVDHIKELGNEVPDAPVIFIKPSTSILADGGEIIIPDYSNDCHHEVELAVLIGKTGRNIRTETAFNHVAGYGVAIDLTLRDVQSRQKAKGLPWEIAKGFDTACPLSDFVPAAAISDPHNLTLTLTVNDTLRQNGNTGLMMRQIPQIIAEISAIFTLEAGDIILTGTPAGVGPIVSGDKVTAKISQVGELRVTVA
ncbi:MAG: fumarylacetoacetate hydrolase family protein [Desulfuromonadales bacterium]|nr:fumarylacetoacetate hydrolase family protein [Desulfuromonadales bacterium]